MTGLSKAEHPRGLCEEDRKEWHKLFRRLLTLYNSMPVGENERKILAGGLSGHYAIFFRGSEEDVTRVIDCLNKKKMKK